MAFNMKDAEMGMLGGTMLGGGLGSMFGGGDDYAKLIGQIPGAVKPYLSPYMHAGKKMLPGLEEQYMGLAEDPAAMLNKLGAGYQQSPGLNFAIQQAMQGAGRSAAAGGMAGSPQAQQLAQEKATGLAQQDYYNWLKQAEGMYGQGLGGMQQLAGMGLQAGTSLADTIAQAMASETQARQAQSASQSAGIGGLLGGIGSIIGGLGLL